PCSLSVVPGHWSPVDGRRWSPGRAEKEDEAGLFQRKESGRGERELAARPILEHKERAEVRWSMRLRCALKHAVRRAWWEGTNTFSSCKELSGSSFGLCS
ncbi:unnamed protein product, partial [Phaeothamnion confervicola]